MHFHIVSLFPEFFNSPLQTSLMAKAQQAGILQFSLHNPRDFAQGAHKQVDDKPYGGGPGMVFMLEPLIKTLRAIHGLPEGLAKNFSESPNSKQVSVNHTFNPVRILVMSPAGKPFTQSMAKELAQEKNICLVCGRYEGFDARLEEIFPIEYVSMGDAVLNGGEVPALAIIEAISRLLPGFMGKESSGHEESFSQGLLEYPHYTRPENFEGFKVPEILCSGHHENIQRWRREAALERTLRHRADLIQDATLDKADSRYLAALPRTRLGKNLYVGLVHHPVIIEGKNSGTSSLTNLDIHDIARSCRSYGLAGFFIIQPLKDQQEILRGILQHWVHGSAGKSHADRAEALKLVRIADSIDDAIKHIEQHCGEKPLLWGSSAEWHEHKSEKDRSLSFPHAREELKKDSCLLLLGTGHGLAPEVLQQCTGIFPPLRFLSDYNHLSVRAAAAILLDRILQEIY